MNNPFLSKNEAIEWLNSHVKFDDPDMVVDRRFMKKLDDTCRLLPDKSGIFGLGKEYSLKHLRQYVKDVKPR